MKKTLLLILFIIGITNFTIAQKKNYFNKYIDSTRINYHEISVGVGFYPILAEEFFKKDYGIYDRYFYDEVINQNYYGITKISLSFNLNYKYKISRIISLGVQFSCGSMERKGYDILTDAYYESNKLNYYAVMPIVKLDWINKSIINLYSSFGVGVFIADNIISNQISNKQVRTMETGAAAQMNFIGLSVGRKLYGFCEISAATTSILTIGIGYRLSYKK